MSDNHTNIITTCLGKALKTEIKFIAMSKFKFFADNSKDLKYKFDNNTKQIVCLGKDSLFLLEGDLKNIVEKICYEYILAIEIDKNSETFSIIIDNYKIRNTKLVNINKTKTNNNLNNKCNTNSVVNIKKILKLKRISVSTKFRGLLIKNILCYYNVYYMANYNILKNLHLSLKKDNSETKTEKLKGISREFNQINLKNYK